MQALPNVPFLLTGLKTWFEDDTVHEDGCHSMHAQSATNAPTYQHRNESDQHLQLSQQPYSSQHQKQQQAEHDEYYQTCVLSDGQGACQDDMGAEHAFMTEEEYEPQYIPEQPHYHQQDLKHGQAVLYEQDGLLACSQTEEEQLHHPEHASMQWTSAEQQPWSSKSPLNCLGDQGLQQGQPCPRAYQMLLTNHRQHGKCSGIHNVRVPDLLAVL